MIVGICFLLPAVLFMVIRNKIFSEGEENECCSNNTIR